MKDGFILYKKMYEPIRSYAIAEKGELLDAIFQYQISGEISTDLSEKVRIAFEFFRVQMDLDYDKYSAKCAKNKDVAKKRWESANACERIQTHAIDADKEKDKEKDKDKEKEKEKKEKVDVDFDRLLSFWNENRGNLPEIKKISPQRKSLIKARYKDYGKENILKVIKLSKESQFLQGDNDRNWTADFDWIFNSTNFLKILEGNYNRQKKSWLDEIHSANGVRFKNPDGSYQTSRQFYAQREPALLAKMIEKERRGEL